MGAREIVGACEIMGAREVTAAVGSLGRRPPRCCAIALLVGSCEVVGACGAKGAQKSMWVVKYRAAGRSTASSF